MTDDATCTGCGTRMIVVEPGQTTHPNCDPSSDDARWIREQHALEAKGRAAALFAQKRAVENAPDDHARAVDVIHAAALSMPVFSANDLRSVDGWEQLHGPVRGAAFTTAIRRGWIEHAGYEPSTSLATHAHDVKKYRSLIHNSERKTA